ncbi:hypothetical protein ACQP2F_00405 [Actinoplanes sp. CA-030573]|uniref:hypothetical protein n=1 Tax=Actinoplanes sp. CA-030573 TaxID=3239898 RepID=UPI003D8EE66D
MSEIKSSRHEIKAFQLEALRVKAGEEMVLMSGDQQHNNGNKWWQSPSAIAAIASLITAVAGLVAALYGNGPA